MLRWLLILIAAVAALGWWRASTSTAAYSQTAPPLRVTGCPLPSLLARADGPVQSPVPAGLAPFRIDAGVLEPLAGFSVDARVISSKRYRHDRESEFSPLDLAVGWGRMREDAVWAQLNLRQNGRFLRYDWRGQPPIPQEEIVRSATNMHLIPSNDGVAEALAQIRDGERVRIDGWLVHAKAPDGWQWRSSLSREDDGKGACEVVYVCGVSR